VQLRRIRTTPARSGYATRGSSNKRVSRFRQPIPERRSMLKASLKGSSVFCEWWGRRRTYLRESLRGRRAGGNSVYHLIVSRHRTCWYFRALQPGVYRAHSNALAKPRSRIRMTHLRTVKLRRCAGTSVSDLLSRRSHRTSFHRLEKRTDRCLPMDRSTLHPKEVCSGPSHGSGRYREREREREREVSRASE
jgi:hypothetical protein